MRNKLFNNQSQSQSNNQSHNQFNKIFNKLNFVICLLSLAACTAKVDSEKTFDPFVYGGDNRPLANSSDFLNGTIDGVAWKLGTALARLNLNGEYSITLAGEGVNLSCSNYMPLAPHISFVVPASSGIYSYDGTGGGRLVNVIFPYSTSTGGGSDNILSAKSQIVIDQMTDQFFEGSVAALAPENLDHNYDFSGKFKAIICGAIPNSALSINKGNLPAFEVKYTETIKSTNYLGSSSYEVRFMDKIPLTKCNTSDIWTIHEYPIHYFTVKVPEKLGNFDIYRGIVEYGFESSSGAISTEAFEGNAKLKSLSNEEIEIALDVSDYAGFGIKAIGTAKSPLCH